MRCWASRRRRLSTSIRRAWALPHSLGRRIIALRRHAVPAAGFLELALAAARECDGPEWPLENVTIGEGLLLPEPGPSTRRCVIAPDANGRRCVQVYSASPDVGETSWRLHMSALIDARGEQRSSGLQVDTRNFREISPKPTTSASAAIGAEIGPLFRGMQTMRRNGRELFADVTLPQDLPPATSCILHSSMRAFQPLGICLEAEDGEGTGTDLFMPIGAGRYAIYRDGATAGMARVTGAAAGADAQSVEADIALFDKEAH